MDIKTLESMVTPGTREWCRQAAENTVKNGFTFEQSYTAFLRSAANEHRAHLAYCAELEADE